MSSHQKETEEERKEEEEEKRKQGGEEEQEEVNGGKEESMTTQRKNTASFGKKGLFSADESGPQDEELERESTEIESLIQHNSPRLESDKDEEDATKLIPAPSAPPSNSSFGTFLKSLEWSQIWTVFLLMVAFAFARTAVFVQVWLFTQRSEG